MLDMDRAKKYEIITIFGYTVCGMLLANKMRENIRSVRFFDNDESKNGFVSMNGECCSLPKVDDLRSLYIITLWSPENRNAVKRQLEEMGVESSDIVALANEDIEELENENDEEYIKCLWYREMGYKLNLTNPVTFNEKLQWLKLNDRKPSYTTMVDKYEVKKYVSDRIGHEYVNPALGVWNSYDDIDFSMLPNKFVLKCTHDSGSVIVCRDKKSFQAGLYRDHFNYALNKNYFYPFREWPYKNVSPRIMAEPFLEAGEFANLIVYKFFCFNGRPQIVQVIQNDKQVDESIDYFDMDWKLLDLRQNFPNSESHLNEPYTFEKMKELASTLSRNISFVRVDFYEIGYNPVFSEFTFYSDAGFAKFEPSKWDEVLGGWIEL